jgi:hypothetical protein
MKIFPSNILFLLCSQSTEQPNSHSVVFFSHFPSYLFLEKTKIFAMFNTTGKHPVYRTVL